ncbi:MAG: hypothetical protein ACJATE_001672 [Bacteroidia bacterium]
MLQKRNHEPNQFPKGEHIKPRVFDKYAVDERGAYILAALIIGCGIAIFLMLKMTLIPILTASRIFISLGLIGFLITFLFKKQLRIGILDGLYYNLFAITPICMVGFLAINMIDTETYTESYQVVSYELHEDHYSLELEDDIYSEFWRIRRTRIEKVPAHATSIQFTFSNGLLGYKIMRESRLH